MSLIASGLLEFEEYKMDRARWQLSWRNDPLPLNRKTFDLLLYLVDHADRVIAKDELLRTLWPESFVEESNLTQHIFLLRKALSRHRSGTKIIETVPGRGYRFAVAVTKVEAEQMPIEDRLIFSASESIACITLEEQVETPDPISQELAVDQPMLTPPFRSRRKYWNNRSSNGHGGSLRCGLVRVAALAGPYRRTAGPGGDYADGRHNRGCRP